MYLPPPIQQPDLYVRRSWTQEETDWVFQSCYGRCFYCGSRLAPTLRKRTIQQGYRAWEIDHHNPFAGGGHVRGGPNHYLNLVASCWKCNLEKLAENARDYWWNAFGLTPRCLGILNDGRRCSYRVNPGKYKYCMWHAPNRGR